MARISDEMFASIPGLIAQGNTKEQIAELFGCKLTTLVVQCSRRRISLRSLRMTLRLKAARRCETINLAADVMEQLPPYTSSQLDALRSEARARGTTEIGLAARLLEMIVKDRLYDAVLGKAGEEMETV